MLLGHFLIKRHAAGDVQILMSPLTVGVALWLPDTCIMTNILDTHTHTDALQVDKESMGTTNSLQFIFNRNIYTRRTEGIFDVQFKLNYNLV